MSLRVSKQQFIEKMLETLRPHGLELDLTLTEIYEARFNHMESAGLGLFEKKALQEHLAKYPLERCTAIQGSFVELQPSFNEIRWLQTLKELLCEKEEAKPK